MKRKGQFVSMIAVVALLFISGGSLFTAMFAQETFGSHVSYYTQDIGDLLEARIEGTFYNYTVKKEMNFTENNVALQMKNKDGNAYLWSSGSIPTFNELKQIYKTKYFGDDSPLFSQNFVDGCTGPSLSKNHLTKDEISIEMSDKSIRCGSRDSYSEVFFGRSNPNEKTLIVHNVNNRWLRIAETAVDLGNKIASGNFDSKIPEGESARDTADFCRNPEYDYDYWVEGSVKFWARQNARDKFLNDHGDAASQIFSDYDKNGFSWISADTNTFYPNRKNEDYKENNIIQEDEDSCTSSKCTESQFDTWEENHCDYNGNDDINWTGSEGDCMVENTYSDDKGECSYDNGTYLKAEATYEPGSVNLSFNIYDSNREMPTKAGMKRARFKLNYTKELQ